MNKKNFLHLMATMMAAMLSVGFASCNSDDDENGLAELTHNQIIELLEGKWEVYGELKCITKGINFDGKYKGLIEFYGDKKFKFSVIEGDKFSSVTNNLGEISPVYLEEYIVDDYYNYTILKKNGKNYIVFGSTYYPYNFEIVSLKTNSLKLILNQDVIDDEQVTGHLYMTMISN